MDDAPAQLLYASQRAWEIVGREVRQRERVSRTASASMEADGRLGSPGLPPLALTRAAVLEGNAQQATPEAKRPFGLIRRELEERQRPHASTGFGVGSTFGRTGLASVPCEILGIQPSDCGSHQLRSPSSVIVAGSSTPRMIVASIRMATARPTPICLSSSELSVAKIPNTPTITTAALVTVPAVLLIALLTASAVLAPPS